MSIVKFTVEKHDLGDVGLVFSSIEAHLTTNCSGSAFRLVGCCLSTISPKPTGQFQPNFTRYSLSELLKIELKLWLPWQEQGFFSKSLNDINFPL